MTWFDDPIEDPLGTLITEVRADTDIQAVVPLDERSVRRVRGFEPRGKVGDTEGDARGPGSYVSFIVLSILDWPPQLNGAPIVFGDISARCYGVTAQGAWAVYAALVKALHKTGTRSDFYQSLIVSGGEQLKDPDTGQPRVDAVIRLVAATHEVA